LHAATGNPEERLALALEAAEKEKGAELDSIEIAKIRAVSKKPVDTKTLKKELGIHLKPFGYSNAELQSKADGESVFPHVFGTDRNGRDIMVRIMVGTRVSMLIGVCAALLVLLIGATYGSISGFFGGKVDAVMMRIVELIYSIPEILVVLLLSTALKPALVAFQDSGEGFFQDLVGIMGPNLISLFVAFGLLYWVTMARIIRGQILQLKEQEFVTAAKALGAGSGRIIKRHLLPNCIGQIVVTTCLQIPSAIFLESFLSFLGVGVSAPMTSLGSMAADGLKGVETFGYRLVIPALILSVMILAFNLFGDGLRDALDPRLKK
ncbi:MAG: ABC transporter permease, partial [Oscillospiraceae bacterium]